MCCGGARQRTRESLSETQISSQMQMRARVQSLHFQISHRRFAFAVNAITDTVIIQYSLGRCDHQVANPFGRLIQSKFMDR